MSNETMEWLASNTAVGNVATEGNFWWGFDQYLKPGFNHFDGFVPDERVKEILGFPVHESHVYVDTPLGLMPIDGKKAIIHGDTGHTFGIFSGEPNGTDGYQVHPYTETLMENTRNLLGEGIGITSVGLLKKGGVAYLQVSLSEDMFLPEFGEAYRPRLLVATSLDGSLASTWKPVITRTACDNTMSIALKESGNVYKIKHSRYSKFKIEGAADALRLISQAGETYTDQIRALTQVDVSDKAWSAFLDAHSPVADAKTGEAKTGKALTMSVTLREALTQLWNNDNRVSPWKGTAWGVLQAVNTYTHHVGIVRGMSRPERNIQRTVMGGIDEIDNATLATLDRVLANA